MIKRNHFYKLSVCLTLVMSFMITELVWAETIRLKSGKTLTGTIVGEDTRSIKLNTGSRVFVIKRNTIDDGSIQDASGVNVEGIKTFPNIEVYMANWCPYCRKLEHFLKANKIPFQKIMIDSSSGRRRFEALGGGGIPYTIIGPYKIRGYDPAGIVYTIKQLQ